MVQAIPSTISSGWASLFCRRASSAASTATEVVLEDTELNDSKIDVPAEE